YRPLDPTGGQVRILDILPSKLSSAPISCVLKHITSSENPVYKALSYTWGRPEPKMSIILDGETFPTLENLEAALRRLRRPKTTRTFWIDALCINQDDTDERAQQVGLMDQIYRNATQVVI
ncbi:HET-domain-containing protein, partial [Aulographum hederae CBS 113979]